MKIRTNFSLTVEVKLVTKYRVASHSVFLGVDETRLWWRLFSKKENKSGWLLSAARQHRVSICKTKNVPRFFTDCTYSLLTVPTGIINYTYLKDSKFCTDNINNWGIPCCGDDLVWTTRTSLPASPLSELFKYAKFQVNSVPWSK